MEATGMIETSRPSLVMPYRMWRGFKRAGALRVATLPVGCVDPGDVAMLADLASAASWPCPPPEFAGSPELPSIVLGAWIDDLAARARAAECAQLRIPSIAAREVA
jgi:hypothetical protein